MTTNTTYREKGRATFLAAIVVLSMVAGAAAFAGTTAAVHDSEAQDIGDVTTLDEDRYWIGQELTITNFTPNETVEFTQDDDFLQRSANGSGELTINTDGWSTGTWNVEGADSGNNGSIRLSTQDISTFEFDPATSDADTTLSIQSDRADYNVTLSADDISASEWNSSISGGTVHDDSFVLELNNAGDDITVDTTELPNGEHSVTAEATDAEASASANLTVEAAADVTTSFQNSPYSAEEGDVADINVSASGTSEAWVNVSATDDQVDYTATVHLTGIEDGSTSFEANTYEMGQGNPADAFDGDDVNDVTVVGDNSDITPNHFTQDFSFRLRSYSADPANNNADGVTRLRLNDRSTGSMTTMVAPSDALDDDPSVSELLDRSTEGSTVAMGDVAVTEVEASGLYGYIGGATDFNTSGAGLEYLLESTTEGPFETSTDTVEINDSMTVLTDAENDRFVVAYPISDVSSAGTDWDVTFRLNDQNPYVDSGNESATGELSAQERSLEFAGSMNDADRLEVPIGSSATVAAETNVAPGTNGSFYVESQDNVYQGDLVVEDGQLAASIDTSAGSSGEILPAVEFTEEGGLDIGTEGTFSGEGDTSSFEASGDAPGTVTVDEDATLDATVENVGDASGEASITVTVGGDEVASNTTELASGDSWTQSFSIPTDSEGDVEWTIDAGDSTASGTVTVEEDTSDGDGDGDGDGMDGDDDTDGNESDDDGDGDGDEQPGFGLVVALFALIGAALLALRRQN